MPRCEPSFGAAASVPPPAGRDTAPPRSPGVWEGLLLGTTVDRIPSPVPGVAAAFAAIGAAVGLVFGFGPPISR
jgi:hypothetical protein